MDVNEVLTAGEYLRATGQDFPSDRVKRSLEMVEEHPPEGTYRPLSDREETRTIRALPSMPSMPAMPSMPSVPAMPSMPSMPAMPSPPSMTPAQSAPSMPQPPTMSPSDVPAINREIPNDITSEAPDITTTSTDVEMIDTTTEDYGSVGEPNCDYDPITFVLKCGLNLITSIFGLSDTCCKPIF